MYSVLMNKLDVLISGSFSKFVKGRVLVHGVVCRFPCNAYAVRGGPSLCYIISYHPYYSLSTHAPRPLKTP